MCPLTLFLGYAVMLETSAHSPGHAPAPVIEAQLCREGLGGYAMATTNGLYAGGLRYAVPFTEDPITVRVAPHLGVSYADHPVPHLPMRTQFDVGIGVQGQVDRYVAGVTYRHWSNGETLFRWGGADGAQNTGLDLLVLQAGIIF
jgi:hypothetical protein